MKKIKKGATKPPVINEEVKSSKKKVPLVKAVVREVKSPKKIQEVKPPVTLREHLEAGWVMPNDSEGLQREGKKVTEIKNIEGQTLHKLKE